VPLQPELQALLSEGGITINTLETVLLTIGIFGALILIHELGHFICARIFDVAINEFAIGMGPRILSHVSKKSGIRYSLRIFPIGGFVSMVGEDESSDDPRSFTAKSVWKRMIITVAGAVMNLILGFILMCILVISLNPDYFGNTTIAKFNEGAVSENSGLMEGDEIISIDGHRTYIFDDVNYEISRNGIKPVDVVVKRSGEKEVIHDVAFPQTSSEGVSFGDMDFKVFRIEKDFPTVVKFTFCKSRLYVKMIWESLIDLCTGRYGIEAVSGPVGAGEAIGTAAKSGGPQLLSFIALITINLGIFNLLPLPALDGGRLFFQIVELIRGKPIKREYEGFVHFIGIIILMGFMLFITFKDIMKLFG